MEPVPRFPRVEQCFGQERGGGGKGMLGARMLAPSRVGKKKGRGKEEIKHAILSSSDYPLCAQGECQERGKKGGELRAYPR